MDLSIIIISYKNAQLISECIRSIYAETHGISFEVIIVDNNSKDGSQEMLLKRFPNVRWIQMGYNSGFARANNEGIRQSKAGIKLLETLVGMHDINSYFKIGFLYIFLNQWDSTKAKQEK